MLATAAFILVAAVSDLSIRNDLVAAAKANDLRLFDQTIERAQNFIETMRVGPRRNAFRREILIAGDISRVWHFEVKSGSLYYDDVSLPFYYDRLASEYPRYPKFILEYRIVDNSGLPHYPIRETRTFLLRLLETNRGKSA